MTPRQQHERDRRNHNEGRSWRAEAEEFVTVQLSRGLSLDEIGGSVGLYSLPGASISLTALLDHVTKTGAALQAGWRIDS